MNRRFKVKCAAIRRMKRSAPHLLIVISPLIFGSCAMNPLTGRYYADEKAAEERRQALRKMDADSAARKKAADERIKADPDAPDEQVGAQYENLESGEKWLSMKCPDGARVQHLSDSESDELTSYCFEVKYQTGRIDGLSKSEHRKLQGMKATHAEQVKHGPFTRWWKNGKKREEGQYRHGLREGVWTYFDSQGKKFREIEFSRNAIGSVKYFDSAELSGFETPDQLLDGSYCEKFRRKESEAETWTGGKVIKTQTVRGPLETEDDPEGYSVTCAFYGNDNFTEGGPLVFWGKDKKIRLEGYLEPESDGKASLEGLATIYESGRKKTVYYKGGHIYEAMESFHCPTGTHQEWDSDSVETKDDAMIDIVSAFCVTKNGVKYTQAKLVNSGYRIHVAHLDTKKLHGPSWVWAGAGVMSSSIEFDDPAKLEGKLLKKLEYKDGVVVKSEVLRRELKEDQEE